MRSYHEILTGMKDRFRELSGMEAGDAGDTGIRLQILAEELLTLESYTDFLERQVFPQTAQGDYLTYHAQTRGLTRKEPSTAGGLLAFKAEPLEEGSEAQDILIPAGTLCAVPGDLASRFTTLEAQVLPAGETAALVPARAVQSGAAGNAAAGTITALVTTIPGIACVTNPGPFTGGADTETDSALLERLLQSYPMESNGANPQYYLEQALSVPQVTGANVMPRARGIGTLDVAVRTQAGPAGEELLEQVQRAVERNREFCIGVRAVSGREAVASVNLQVQVKSGFEDEPVRAAAQAAALAYIDGLSMGSPMRLSRLGQALLLVEGVENYHILSPAMDLEPQADQWLRGDVTVTTYR